jgi:hypothetical protein
MAETKDRKQPTNEPHEDEEEKETEDDEEEEEVAKP